MPHFQHRLLTLCASLLLAFGSSAALAAQEIPSTVTVQPVPNLRSDFIMGADVSMLDQIERVGGKFSDQSGQQKDALAILKANGVNWLRLRLWHTPVNSEDVVEGGKVISHKGDPKGGGNNDLATTIRLATRAKALGLKVLLDIHYSDFWVDPEKQDKPAAWKDLHGAALEQAVYQYTVQSLTAMRTAGVYPDMVQVGNELNGGMLWPDGKTWKSKPGETIGGDDGFAALMKQGIKGVRDTDPAAASKNHIKVAIHLANGTSNELYRRVFDMLQKKGVDYDVIGLSYYPYLHGTVEELQNNMDDIAFRYEKQVAVMEVSYAYTLADGDGFPNIFSADNQKTAGYKASVQGQASLIRDTINALSKVPAGRGLGLFYWEPDWIPVAGAGWRTGEGNAWDNQAMFDFSGRALPSMAVFKRVRDAGTPADTPHLLAAAPLQLTAYVGENWAPPETLRLPFSDEAERPVFIAWDDVPAAKLNTPGHFTLRGEVSGQPDMKADVEVVPRRNLIPDPGFENGTLDGWTIEGASGAVSNERNPGNAHSGQHSIHYWLGEPFHFKVLRTFTKIPNGNYTLRAWSAGGSGEKVFELFAKDCGGEAPKPTPMVNSGWQKWHQYVVKDIKVTSGSCTIGVNVDAQTGTWGNIDDIEFVREGA
ncbi:glycosyl hydrolase 53 family protein [Andreprevotia chitinilytica]|uniref:glycosyl hydrolase 53 family protein n=1 Tax=Andreprevotia chitinilytica TaxID=396808 RepID=UPI000553BA4C|nr:glycosyl hydrolase 53 family protein [Andreprevotia chitinilytica]